MIPDLSQLDTIHGVKNLLASFCGLIVVYIAKDVFIAISLLFSKNKKPTRDEFAALTKAIQDHKDVMAHQDVTSTNMAMDIQRIYLFLKMIAGDKWPTYFDKVKNVEKENDELSFSKKTN